MTRPLKNYPLAHAEKQISFDCFGQRSLKAVNICRFVRL
jgi:hypothetical protein